MLDLPPGTAIAPELRRWAVTDDGGNLLDDGNEILRFLSAAPDHAQAVLEVHFERRLRSPLGPRLTELVRLAVAQQTGCPVCQSVRRPAARREGVDEALIAAALTYPVQAELTDRERLAVRYAGLLAGDHQQITDATYEELAAQFDRAEIAELALIAASFLAQGRILETLTRGMTCPVQHEPA